MNVDRTVLLQFRDEERRVTFRVERWFMAVDHIAESAIKVALVWDDGEDNERVVLLGTAAARAVIGELVPFAGGNAA